MEAVGVGRLLQMVQSQFDRHFRGCWVRGELTQLTSRGRGHLYFSLRDGEAVLKCALWSSQRQRLEFTPSEGITVLVKGSLNIYPAQGQMQLIVEHMIPDGVGQYFQALEQLRKRLLAEGLLAAERKRPLPFFPRRVGVVTSSEGAVWHDIQTTLERRNPAVQLVLSPAPVQGPEAVPGLIRALRLLIKVQVEVVILARGGGSWEDLMAFNAEPLVRFLAHYPLPVIAAIGHETDTSLVDLVADFRAPTPTAAAEQVAPESEQLRRDLRRTEQLLRHLLSQRVLRQRQTLDNLSGRPWFTQPERLWERQRWRLDQLSHRLPGALREQVHRQRRQLNALTMRVQPEQLNQHCSQQHQEVFHLGRQLRQLLQQKLQQGNWQVHEQRQLLQSLSPRQVLNRGYAFCRDAQGRILRQAQGVVPGSHIEVHLCDGQLACEVLESCGERAGMPTTNGNPGHSPGEGTS